MDIAGSGIEASRLRMDTASSNLVNADSSAPNPESVYRTQRVRLTESTQTFQDKFGEVAANRGVEASVVDAQKQDPVIVYDPTHPDANEQGMVAFPDVDLTSELSELMAARRAYEAALASYRQSKEAFMATLDIVRT